MAGKPDVYGGIDYSKFEDILSSKYALFERAKGLTQENILEGTTYNPDLMFDGRYTSDGVHRQEATPSDFWDGGGITLESGQEYVAIYGKAQIPTAC